MNDSEYNIKFVSLNINDAVSLVHLFGSFEFFWFSFALIFNKPVPSTWSLNQYVKIYVFNKFYFVVVAVVLLLNITFFS